MYWIVKIVMLQVEANLNIHTIIVQLSWRIRPPCILHMLCGTCSESGARPCNPKSMKIALVTDDNESYYAYLGAWTIWRLMYVRRAQSTGLRATISRFTGIVRLDKVL